MVEIDKLSTRFAPENIAADSLLSHAETIRWECDRRGLRVTMTSAKSGEHAFAFEVETR